MSKKFSMKVSQYEKARAEEHQRTYKSPLGEFSNIWAICLRNSVTSAFAYKVLGNSQLNSSEMGFSINRPDLGPGVILERPEKTWPTKEADRIIQVALDRTFPVNVAEGRWENEHTFVDNVGVRHCPRMSVPVHFPRETSAIVKRNQSRFGPVHERQVSPPFRQKGRKRSSVFPIHQIADRIQHRDLADAEKLLRPGWLNWSQLKARKGVTDHWIDYWKNKDSILRHGEKALRCEKTRRLTHKCGKNTAEIFSERDADNILEGKEAPYPRGTGRFIDQARIKRFQEAKNLLQGILQDGPHSLDDIRVKAKERKISENLLRKAADELKVQKTGAPFHPAVWSLGSVPAGPGKVIPSAANSRPSGLSVGDQGHPVHVTNVVTVRFERDGQTHAPPADDGENDSDGEKEVDKWSFRTGEASYDGGAFFDVTGVLRDLLIRLAEVNGRTVSNNRLKEACGNKVMEDSTLRNHVCRLNSLLKKGLTLETNPVTFNGGGYRLQVS